MNYQKLYSKGLKFNKEGKYQKAIREFDKILERNPTNADAYSDRGVSKFHLNDLQGALDDLNKSVNLEPENPYRYASRAFMRERNGDIEGAIADYKRSIELDPENAISHNNLGLLEEKLGYMEMAKKRFRKADDLIDISPLPQIAPNVIQETDEVIHNLLAELKIPIQQEKAEVKSIWRTMMLIFTSRTAMKDYFRFIFKGYKN